MTKKINKKLIVLCFRILNLILVSVPFQWGGGGGPPAARGGPPVPHGGPPFLHFGKIKINKKTNDLYLIH